MPEKILITGGAGFIGYHCTCFFSQRGFDVVVLDNLSRKGAPFNLDRLKSSFDVTHHLVDIRNNDHVNEVFKREAPFSAVIHLAAQVAVTTSVVNPREDFEINALGTMNLLESFRSYSPGALFIYASTNKVYGKLKDIPLHETDKSYVLKDRGGIDENRALDFHSPYGCSKGSADQYVIDYGRIYNLHTVCFRQSCIYGTQQFGVEDQGWVAWFIIAGVMGRPVTIYGNGKQARDLLYVEDLVDLYSLALHNRENLNGEVFNIGGGQENTLSLLQLIDLLRDEGIDIQYSFDNWRAGDQEIFVSNNRKAEGKLNWAPRTPIRDGIQRLLEWVKENRSLLNQVLTSSSSLR